MDFLIKRANDAERALNQKTVRTVRNPEIEKRVVQFITIARQAHRPVATNLIIGKALNVKQQILKDRCTAGTQAALKKFSASKGWVNKFVSRHGFRSAALHGEASSVSINAVAAGISNLRTILSN